MLTVNTVGIVLSNVSRVERSLQEVQGGAEEVLRIAAAVKKTILKNG